MVSEAAVADVRPRRWHGAIVACCAIVLAIAAAGCSSDVVCEEVQDTGDSICQVKSRSDCRGTAHEMTESDKELTGQFSLGHETCYGLGYTHPYLGGYMKPRTN
ncbi:MAG: hypothetical protein HYY06_15385 [Deltaproteobacteria bacterium]|nr:hypothetical protein [Deltaproteobacteria bacterium]